MSATNRYGFAEAEATEKQKAKEESKKKTNVLPCLCSMVAHIEAMPGQIQFFCKYAGGAMFGGYGQIDAGRLSPVSASTIASISSPRRTENRPLSLHPPVSR